MALLGGRLLRTSTRLVLVVPSTFPLLHLFTIASSRCDIERRLSPRRCFSLTYLWILHERLGTRILASRLCSCTGQQKKSMTGDIHGQQNKYTSASALVFTMKMRNGTEPYHGIHTHFFLWKVGLAFSNGWCHTGHKK